MNVQMPLPASRRGRYIGIVVGVTFCLVAAGNQAYILPQLVPQGDPARQILQSVVYWFAGLSAVVHVFLWATYASLVTAVARIAFEGDANAMRFSDAFGWAGLAHVPLVAWGALVCAVWISWTSPLQSPQIRLLFAIYAVARAAAYLSGVLLMAILLYRRRRDRAFASALVVAGAPAVALWLGLSLVNGAVGAFVPSE